jgi:carboxyl-terminal processing protease
MNSRIKYLIVSASSCLAVLLLIGSVLGQGATPADDPYKHIGVFSDVVSRIKTEYVEEPDMKSVTMGALNGLLEAIDPFASYLNAEQYKDYVKNKDLKRADVGLILSKRFGYVAVVGTVPGSPAAKAGLSTNDMIETIKGIATRDMPLAYAGLLLRRRRRQHRGAQRGARAAARAADREADPGRCSRCRPSRAKCCPARWATSTSMRFPRPW